MDVPLSLNHRIHRLGWADGRGGSEAWLLCCRRLLRQPLGNLRWPGGHLSCLRNHKGLPSWLAMRLLLAHPL